MLHEPYFERSRKNMSILKRRQFLSSVLSGTAAATVSSRSNVGALCALATAAPGRQPISSSLAEPAFRPLPLGSIVPGGWLKRQLRLQADGLSGHLDEFWPDVGQSQWFGGKAEGWERAPYWLDGVIPLAWLLDDSALQSKVKRYIDTIVSHQRPDGWYSPYPVDASAKSYDLWSILLANKALVQYHEATADASVLQAVLRNLKATLDALDRTPLFGWGKFRWFEGLISVYYAYEKTGEAWLLDLARKFHNQGFDYQAFYSGEDVTLPTPRRGLWRWDKHVVNTGMALKAYALAWRLTRQESERAFPLRMLEILDRYHGQVTGMFSGDECLAGKNPLQGTELCAVVETLYSLEQLLSLSGNPVYGDRLERIAFNALPAPFAPDMWTHQYDQQVNQVQCTINPDYLWSTNGPESNLYGLEPDFGCCTSNMHQGWPKFAAHLWMAVPGRGIAAMAYAPSTVQFKVDGSPVRIEQETDYPFHDAIRLKVTSDKPSRFPLLLRVPAWAEGASLQIGVDSGKPIKPGAFHRLEQEWKGEISLLLRFPMRVKTSRRYNGALSIERGPLVYSLKLGEAWKQVNAGKPHREPPHGDYEVRPSSPWNYGIVVDESHPESSVTFKEKPVGEKPFSPEGAGILAKVKGRKLPGWKLENGWAGEVPPGPQESSEPIEELTLIPYGCTNIRVTEFPRIKGSSI
jgi:uncharacterized protein